MPFDEIDRFLMAAERCADQGDMEEAERYLGLAKALESKEKTA